MKDPEKSGPDKPLAITIWDSSPRRIAVIDRNLHRAAEREGLRLRIGVMSEPPLLGRHNLEGRVPALEIAGRFWRLRPFDIFTEAECRTLLRALTGRGREG